VTLAGKQEADVADTASCSAWLRGSRLPNWADLSKLSVTDRRVIAKLVEPREIVTALFLRQVWSGNEAMLQDLAATNRPRGARGCTIS